MASDDENDLIIVTSATDQVEAGALRAYLEASGIQVHIQGEHHGSMLSQFGGAAAIEMNVMVPRRQAQEAHELIVAFRDGEVISDDAADADDADEPSEEEDRLVDQVALKHEMRRIGMMAFFGFGMAHFAAGAPLRALLCLAMFVASVPIMLARGPIWVMLMPISMAFDFIGARQVVRERRHLPLPTARLVRDKK